MTELEQLRADLATLEAAQETINQIGRNRFPSNYWREIKEFAIVTDLKKRIADLEAQQEQVDRWTDVKEYIDGVSDSDTVKRYIRHLEAKVAELEEDINTSEFTWMATHAARLLKERDDALAKVAELADELRCERIDGGKVRDDQKAISAEKSREKLAELTTIQNAIPPACGLAREIVERWIEVVKKEMQEATP